MDVLGPLASPYVDAIKQFEGFNPNAYGDYKQLSIGYGTRARYPGERITRDEAEARLNSELGDAGGLVATHFPDLTPGQHAALTSLTFNAGSNWINSGLGAAVRAGDWDTARRLFSQYNKAGGSELSALKQRRAEELGWLDGEPGALSYAAAEPQGRTRMADQPSLAARFIAGGPGALFGGQTPDEGGMDLGTRLNNAAAWALALDTGGKSLGGIQGNKNQFQLVTGADGSLYRLNQRTGGVEPLAGAKAQIVKIGTGPFGDVQGIQKGENIYTMDGRLIARAGVPVGAGEGGGGPGAVGNNLADLGMQQALKPGVKYDDALQGPERLAQFKPEYAREIEDYYNGLRQPTGRGDKYSQWLKREAGLLGESLGVPFNEQSFAAKRTMLNDENKSTPGSLGGQQTSVLATLKHFGELKDAYGALNNTGLSDVPVIGAIPGTGKVSNAINAVVNSGAKHQGEVNSVSTAVNHAVEEAAKFYAGSQAAQAERERIHANFSSNLQPSASDASLKTERNLLADKGREVLANMERTLGPNHPSTIKFRDRLDKALTDFDAKFASKSRPDFNSFFK